jgi:peptidyl-prolyl cis-trans isomerase-like 4
VLFVCKLNPVTQDEDLELIFSRFGKILSCEVIRDKRTGDSLQYAFIEYTNQKDCEQAYFKMDGVLIDDHRIHVDFSQSVSKIADDWRDVTNKKRRRAAGGFGGIDNLEKKKQYRDGSGRQIMSDSVVNNLVVDRDVAQDTTQGPKDSGKDRRRDDTRRRERREEYHEDGTMTAGESEVVAQIATVTAAGTGVEIAIAAMTGTVGVESRRIRVD